MWQSLDKIPAFKIEVLCGWKPQSGEQWTFEVLIHWPDGVWTDTQENEINQDELPDFWQFIHPPHWATCKHEWEWYQIAGEGKICKRCHLRDMNCDD